MAFRAVHGAMREQQAAGRGLVAVLPSSIPVLSAAIGRRALSSASRASSGGKFGASSLLAAAAATAAVSGGAYLLVSTVEGESSKPDNDNAKLFGEENAEPSKPRVVVLGSGWGALKFVSCIDADAFDVTIISPRNYFLFTPLLPGATVGSVEPRSIVEPIRRYCARNRINATFFEAKATDIDHEAQIVTVEDVTGMTSGVSKTSLSYDHLVVAVGAKNNTFGMDIREHVYFLKEIEDAETLRRAILDAFETAAFPNQDEATRERLLHFVFVGGGPTCCEAASELADFMGDVGKLYPTVAEYAKITLVQSNAHILNAFDESLSIHAEERFRRKNINVLTNTRVTHVEHQRLLLSDKTTGEVNPLDFQVAVWSTGVAPRSLVRAVQDRLPEVQNNRRGLRTNAHLRCVGMPNVYAIGDCASVERSSLVSTVKSLFREFDKDQSGTLDPDEFEAFLTYAVVKYPQLKTVVDRVRKEQGWGFFDYADENKDGVVSEAELEKVLLEVDRSLKAFPATAQVAAQQGAFLGKHFNTVVRSAAAEDGAPPFVYHHQGMMANIGEGDALMELGPVKISGWITFWMWRSAYLGKQVSFRCRVSLALDWFKTTLFGRDCSNI